MKLSDAQGLEAILRLPEKSLVIHALLAHPLIVLIMMGLAILGPAGVRGRKAEKTGRKRL